MIPVSLFKSPKKEKKFRVVFANGHHVDFGQMGYSDFTIHKDPERMHRYVRRHSHMGETWSLSKGIETAGFWSRWLLWSKPSMVDAKRYMSHKFGIKFVSKTFMSLKYAK
jgi:hypothetical protein